MVKGVSRRVVVVRPEEHDVFEQAIFLVRDCSVSRSDIVREACRVADRYLLTGARRKRRRLAHSAALFLLGAAVASAVWLCLLFVCK